MCCYNSMSGGPLSSPLVLCLAKDNWLGIIPFCCGSPYMCSEHGVGLFYQCWRHVPACSLDLHISLFHGKLSCQLCATFSLECHILPFSNESLGSWDYGIR